MGGFLKKTYHISYCEYIGENSDKFDSSRKLFMTWLDRIPLTWLAAVAVWMALAPFTPEPHLLEKLRMLLQGTLTRPLDIFDLLLHASPLILLGLRLWRRRKA
jgi:hypothetical protein